jgi:outer membrane protein insertion porin family
MIKKLLIFLYFLCSFSSISFSEIINSFNVEGNDRVSKNTIINFSELKLGSDISESDLNNSLKKLYDTNFFKDIILEVRNNTLNIKVVELPVIQEDNYSWYKVSINN